MWCGTLKSSREDMILNIKVLATLTPPGASLIVTQSYTVHAKAKQIVSSKYSECSECQTYTAIKIKSAAFTG